MPKQESRPETADKISVLVRIYRAAVRSGDESLRRATAVELRNYGVDVAQFLPPESEGGGS